jgi:hypothetical protein
MRIGAITIISLSLSLSQKIEYIIPLDSLIDKRLYYSYLVILKH